MVTTAGVASFAGPNQGVNLPSNVFGNYGTAVSIEMWVTTTSDNRRYSRLFQFGPATGTDANTIGVYNDWYGTGKIYMMVGQRYYGSNFPFAAQTLHVVLTMSVGNYVRLYVNGSLAITAPTALTVIPTPTFFHVGYWSYGDDYLVGSVRDFRIWGGALSADEVVANFFGGAGWSHFVAILYSRIHSFSLVSDL